MDGSPQEERPRTAFNQTPQCQVGDRFGKLTAVRRYQRSRTGARWSWIFQCECGNETVRQIKSVRGRDDVACHDCMVNVHPLTEDQKRIVEEYFPIAKKMVSHFQRIYGRWAKWNDAIESAGMYGLMLAVIHQEKQKRNDINLREYIFKKLKRQIRTEVIYNWRPSEQIDEQELVDPEPFARKMDTNLDAENHFAKMTDEEAEIVHLYYQGYSFDDIKILVDSTFGTVRRRFLSGMSKAKDEPQPQKKVTRQPVVVPGLKKRNKKNLPLNEEQKDLSANYVPLARSMSKPYKVAYPRFKDEFESAALMALIESARSFDNDRGLKFATFARFRISGALKDVLRRFYHWEQNCEEAVETVLDQEDMPDEGSIDWLVRRLPEKHRKVCTLLYKEGKTQTEVGEIMGYSQTEITRLHKRSIEMFQAEKSMLLGELEDRRMGKSRLKKYDCMCRYCGTTTAIEMNGICPSCSVLELLKLN